MATYYNGNPGNESRVTALSIASSTNASPIVVTTSASHGLVEGDRVEIRGHTTNYSANGIWFAHVLSATTIALYSAWTSGAVATPSSGVGVGGATGTVTYLGIRPQVSLISSGDPSLNILAAVEDATDAKTWLAERLGNYRLDQSYLYAQNSATDASWDSWSTNTGLSVSTWTADPNFQNYTSGSPLCQAQLLSVVNNAEVDLEFTGSIDNSVTGSGGLRLAFYYQKINYGVTPAFGSATRMPGSGIIVNETTGSSARKAVNVRGSLQSIGALYGQQIAFWLAVYTAGTAYNLIGDRMFTAKVYYPQA